MAPYLGNCLMIFTVDVTMPKVESQLTLRFVALVFIMTDNGIGGRSIPVWCVFILFMCLDLLVPSQS